MESENPFPEFKLFDPLAPVRAVGHFIKRFVSFCPLEAPDYMSTHNRGAAPQLDQDLYDDTTQQVFQL